MLTPLAVATLTLLACGPLTAVRERLEPDVAPPALLGLRAIRQDMVELTFDESIACPAGGVQILPACEIRSLAAEGCLLLVEVAGQVPGLPYHLEATVEDLNGNALQFLARFYGFNPRVPALLINELTVRGSGSHPDLVELKVLAPGDMGGVVIYEGTPSDHGERLVFPCLEVAAGDFLLVHFRPQGIAEERDELVDTAASGGLDASDQAWDFWVPAGDGLPGNNGVVSLYARPGGPILDGFLYSNRSSASDELYLGFGTREAMARALELAADGGWAATGPQGAVRPEDAVSPEGSTATRSICRDPSGTDTDTAADWHIVPTSGFSFGAENSVERYRP